MPVLVEGPRWRGRRHGAWSSSRSALSRPQRYPRACRHAVPRLADEEGGLARQYVDGRVRVVVDVRGVAAALRSRNERA
jgi:hypothetical protein